MRGIVHVIGGEWGFIHKDKSPHPSPPRAERRGDTPVDYVTLQIITNQKNLYTDYADFTDKHKKISENPRHLSNPCTKKFLMSQSHDNLYGILHKI
jgi:hypothetical protein